ncbi:MAG: hypothetical protein EOO24_06975 [Comamonadaceae bacterium]|nr:MAG: hypothetical protein EOO24_06975 [Comamonadaceae bacterium]
MPTSTAAAAPGREASRGARADPERSPRNPALAARATPRSAVVPPLPPMQLRSGAGVPPGRTTSESRTRAVAGAAAVSAAAAAVGAAGPAAQSGHGGAPIPRQGGRRSAPILAANPAETRLIEIYELFGRGQSRQALLKAEKLVQELPNFQLAQLVYADLLAARIGTAAGPGDAVTLARLQSSPNFRDLQLESQRRLLSLRERPPSGTVPSQLLAVSPRSRHAIAVDASRSRLYLLENGEQGMRLVADYYISVGKSGIGKAVEGDARTPLGLYHVTSNLDPKSLRDFYGAGALPINYPNPFDQRRGRTGGGIWLHGTPPQQFARPPQATDGCVVLTNVDLRDIIRSVDVGATPVVIAQRLVWITPEQARTESGELAQVLAAWRDALASGDAARLQAFYLPEFQRTGRRMADRGGIPNDVEITRLRGRKLDFKDMSILRWKDGDDALVATFGSVVEGERTGRTRRQYWLRQAGHWKLFQEELLG